MQGLVLQGWCMNKLLSYLSLFASTGTLFCCALPSLLVALGMGATMAGLVSAVPQIVWLSQYKSWVFLGSGGMITVASIMHYRTRNEPCPIDPDLAKACKTTRKVSYWSLLLSGLVWCVGAFFAFIAPLLGAALLAISPNL